MILEAHASDRCAATVYLSRRSLQAKADDSRNLDFFVNYGVLAGLAAGAAASIFMALIT
jgi:hypothetical protein